MSFGRRSLRCVLFLVLLFLWCEVPVNAEGQTEVSAWVEASKDPDRPDNPDDKDPDRPDDPDDKDPDTPGTPDDKNPDDMNPGGQGSDAGRSDGSSDGAGSEDGRGDSVETGDRSIIFTPIILLLLGGILITAEGIRRNDG